MNGVTGNQAIAGSLDVQALRMGGWTAGTFALAVNGTLSITTPRRLRVPGRPVGVSESVMVLPLDGRDGLQLGIGSGDLSAATPASATGSGTVSGPSPASIDGPGITVQCQLTSVRYRSRRKTHWHDVTGALAITKKNQ